jgi:hypothetical protein
MSRLVMYWRNTKDMPFILGMLCRGGMLACPGLLLFLVIPVNDWTVNGKRMSYAELWQSGAGLSSALFFGLGIVGTWGLAARQPWSRWALVATPILPIVFFPGAMLTDLKFVIINASLTALATYAYLFHLRSVREYLQRQ